MSEPKHRRVEEHLAAEEDDGSAELQPEDGGAAPASDIDEHDGPPAR
jgi:hypothetical protein